jgi:hypothetical protein
MAVVDPGSLILTAGRQAQVGLHLLLPFSGQPTLGALPSSLTQTTAVAATTAQRPPAALPAW